IPSFVAREAFLLALAIPLVRKIVSALTRSLSASSKARLQSIMPAFVFSRSCLTSLGSISAITFIEFEFDCVATAVRRKRRPSRFVLGCGLRRLPKQSRRPAFAARSGWRESRRRFPESDNRSVRDRRSYRQSQLREYYGGALH